MSKINDLEEASVGTMLPITTSDQTLAKNTPGSIDDEFGALTIFSNNESVDEEDDFEEGVDDILAKIGTLRIRKTMKRENSGDKETIKKILNYINHVEKYLINTDKSFVPYGKLVRKVESVPKEKGKEARENMGLDENAKLAAITLYNGKEPVLQCIANVSKDPGKKQFMYDVTGKYSKYKKYYTDIFLIKYMHDSFDAKTLKNWESISNAVDEKKPIRLEYAEDDTLFSNGIDSIIYESMEKQKNSPCVVFESPHQKDEEFTEAAKIDDDIKDIIKTLNEKGYKTLYSCSGHPSARLKSDGKRDGIKDKHLYSTAKIVFAENYKFDSIPNGWERKDLDDGNVGIYVNGPRFRIINGLPTDQFYNWKKRYMYHLEKWANDLPNKEDLNKKDKDISESMNELFQDLMIDLS